MRTVLVVVLLGMLWAAPGGVEARSSVPIVNVEDQSIVREDGKSLTADQVRRAIIIAGSISRREEWSFREQGEGVLVGTLVIRGKHTARVNVRYSATQLSILYRDSEKLNFEKGKDGRDSIHPNYNKWVSNLLRAIKREVQRVE
jgi:hypothetical protein